jgi:hypothetical protein
MRNLMICTPHLVLFGDKIEKNEMGGACGTYGGEEGHIRGFDGEIGRKETTWES